MGGIEPKSFVFFFIARHFSTSLSSKTVASAPSTAGVLMRERGRRSKGVGKFPPDIIRWLYALWFKDDFLRMHFPGTFRSRAGNFWLHLL